MLRCEPAFGPAGLWRELHFNEIPQRLPGDAGFYYAFQLMVLTHNTQWGVGRERTVQEHLNEPFSNLFQVAKHGRPTTAVGAGDEYQLRTKITADRFWVAHGPIVCTY